MDFPRFQRTNITAWIQQCERYFELDGTLDNWKARIASVNLDEKAWVRHKAYEEDEGDRTIPLAEYKRALRIRFGSPFESPGVDFKKLHQTGSLEEYDDEFDTLRCKLKISKEHAVQAASPYDDGS